MNRVIIICVFLVVASISFGQGQTQERSFIVSEELNSLNASNEITKENFYFPTDKLEYIRRCIYESSDDEISMKRYEDDLRKSIADGNVGPWQNLVPKLTREECIKMPTSELAQVCFSTSLFTRLLLLYDKPVHAFSVAKVRYPCYEELFNRDDLWQGILGAYSIYSSGLDPKGEPNNVMDAIIGLDNLPLVFQCNKMREQLKGRELLFIRAQVNALKKIRLYIKNDDDNSTVSATPFFSVTAPISMINHSLVFAQKVSEEKSKTLIDNISKLQLSTKPKMGDIKNYIDISIAEFQQLLNSYPEKKSD